MKKKDFPHSPHTPRKIIWYDGICNLCHWSVRFVKRHDKKGIFSYQPLQKAGEGLATSVKKGKNYPDTIVYQHGETPYERSDAVLMIARDLGGVWRWFYYLKIVPKSWRDALYDLVAKYRYRIFGKRASCAVR